MGLSRFYIGMPKRVTAFFTVQANRSNAAVRCVVRAAIWSFFSGMLILATSSQAGAWVRQDLASGFGTLKMGGPEFRGRFGGGAWGRVNGVDLDGDQDIDLVVTFGIGGGAMGTCSGLFVYSNVGSAQEGVLNAGMKLAAHAEIKGAVPLVGDANSDGRPDILCNGLLFLNRSVSGGLSFAAAQPMKDPGWRHPEVCDWNQDGVSDRFLEDRWRLRWIDGRTGQTASLKAGSSDFLTDLFVRPFACDWDADGDLDLLIGQESGHITFIKNEGGSLLSESYIEQFDPDVDSGCASVPTLCDWDGDGDVDMIVGNAAGFLEYFESDAGGFLPVRRLQADGVEVRILAGELGSIQGPEEARWGYAAPQTADWDLDGDLDLLVGCVTGEQLFFENTGSRIHPRLAAARRLEVEWGGRQPVLPARIRYTPEPDTLITQTRCRPVVLDWNGDHLPDYITIDHKGALACYPRFRRPDGSLGLHPAEYPFRDPSGEPLQFCSHPNPGRNGRIKFCFADWDGDGDLDLIRSAGTPDGLHNLDNHGNFTYLECIRREPSNRAVFEWRGELVPSGQIRLQGHTSAPVVVDLDGNGTLDIVSGCEDGRIYWFTREWIDQLASKR
jgi:hypothetical protein